VPEDDEDSEGNTNLEELIDPLIWSLTRQWIQSLGMQISLRLGINSHL